MEPEIDYAAVVAADRASSTSFVNESSLQLLLPAGDRLAHTALTRPLMTAAGAPAVLRELGHAVTLTAAHPDRARSALVRRASLPLGERDWSFQVWVDPLPLPRHNLIIQVAHDEIPANRSENAPSGTRTRTTRLKVSPSLQLT